MVFYWLLQLLLQLYSLVWKRYDLFEIYRLNKQFLKIGFLFMRISIFGHWDSGRIRIKIEEWILSLFWSPQQNRNDGSFSIWNRVRSNSYYFGRIIRNCIFTIQAWWSVGSLIESLDLPQRGGQIRVVIPFFEVVWLWFSIRKKKITLCRIWTYGIGFWRPVFYQTELRAPSFLWWKMIEDRTGKKKILFWLWTIYLAYIVYIYI